MAAPNIRYVQNLRTLRDIREEDVAGLSVAPVSGYITGTNLSLSWNAVGAASGYRINISAGGGSFLTNVDAPNASYTFLSLPAGAVIVTVYAIVSGNLVGSAGWSGSISSSGGVIDPPVEPPSPYCSENLRGALDIRTCPDIRNRYTPGGDGDGDGGGDTEEPYPCAADIREAENIRACPDIRGGEGGDGGGEEEGGGEEYPDGTSPDISLCAENIRAAKNIRACPDIRSSFGLVEGDDVGLAKPRESATVHIWNMALGYIGTRTVASEEEKTPEAYQCRLYWDAARKQALRDFPWNFAQARAKLAEVEMPDAWEGEWRYAYTIPELCLKIHSVQVPKGDTKPYKIVSGNDGTPIILTDVPMARADYTQDVRCPNEWDDLFIGMIARKLAAMIAVAILKNNPQKVQELEQLYRSAQSVTYEAGASEQKQRPDRDSWLESRGTYDY